MKRCPECQFLYEDESLKCDMDGTPLRYTVALPRLPGLAKSIWDRWTIGLLGAVILTTVLVILYRATPRAYTSSMPAAAIKEIPSPNQNAQPAATETPSDSSVNEDASSETSDAISPSEDSDGARDPFDSQSTTAATRAQRSKRSSLLADEKESAPAPVIHIEPAASLPAVGTASTAAKPTINTAEKSAAQTAAQPPSSSATSAHPKPPENYSNKPTTENQKKDSGVKSFFKKAGKVLKKPFGEN
jgi:hypothetical protein